jgi:hypothetical protein
VLAGIDLGAMLMDCRVALRSLPAIRQPASGCGRFEADPMVDVSGEAIGDGFGFLQEQIALISVVSMLRSIPAGPEDAMGQAEEMAPSSL